MLNCNLHHNQPSDHTVCRESWQNQMALALSDSSGSEGEPTASTGKCPDGQIQIYMDTGERREFESKLSPLRHFYVDFFSYCSMWDILP